MNLRSFSLNYLGTIWTLLAVGTLLGIYELREIVESSAWAMAAVGLVIGIGLLGAGRGQAEAAAPAPAPSPSTGRATDPGVDDDVLDLVPDD